MTKDENDEGRAQGKNGKRMYAKQSTSAICPACKLFRKESKVCTRCHREGCENCVCDEGICMACDLGS